MASIPVAQAREDVAALFLSYLGRAPEFTAMNYYVGLYNQLLAAQGDAAAAVDNAFKALSAQIYVDAGNIGEIPAGPSVTDGEYVDWIYQNVLGRAADEAGRAYWIEQLEAGAIDRAELVGIVIAAAGDDVRDAAYLANRTEVALEFAKFENSNPQIIGSLQFNAKQVLEGVNEDPASITAAEAKLESATNGGQTFTLTPGVDNLTGTSGNDVFNALPVNSVTGDAATTLNQYDTIDGGAGRDTLNIYVQGQNNITQQGTVRNVEVINIHNDLNNGNWDLFGKSDVNNMGRAPARVVDAGAFEGAEQVWQFGRAAEVVNLGTGVVAGLSTSNQDWWDVRAANGSAVASVAFADVALEYGEFELSVYGKSLTGVVVTGEVVSADADDKDVEFYLELYNTDRTLKGDVTFTVDTAIDAHVWVGVDSADAKVVGLDASASTGAISYTLDKSVTTVKGGAGDDVFYVSDARGLRLSDSIDGGAGIDTVVLGRQGKLVTQDYDAIAQLQNIEVLAFAGDEVWFDAAKLTTFESIEIVGFSGVAGVSNLADGQVLTFVDDADFRVFEPSGSTVILDNAAANVALDLENVNLKVIAHAEDYEFPFLGTNSIKTGETGGTLTVTGEGSLNYDNAQGKFSAIDVSGFEGSVNVSGMSGSVLETVTLGEDVSGYIAVTVASEDGPSSTHAAIDTIIGFKPWTAETDATDFVGGIGQVATVKLASTVSTLDAAFAQAASAYAGTISHDDVVLFQFDGNTYLYADNNGDGKYGTGDFAIEFVGLYDANDFLAA